MATQAHAPRGAPPANLEDIVATGPACEAQRPDPSAVAPGRGGPIRKGGRPSGRLMLGRNALAELTSMVDQALCVRGEGRRAREALGMGPVAWSRLLNRLGRLGFARTVTVYDPRLVGRPCEGVSLVKLRLPSPTAMARFEEVCRDDPAVHGAARITGRFDYQLGSCHAGLLDAERWRRRLEGHPDVLRIEQRTVRTVIGHGLRDIPLCGFKRPCGGGRRRAIRRDAGGPRLAGDAPRT